MDYVKVTRDQARMLTLMQWGHDLTYTKESHGKINQFKKVWKIGTTTITTRMVNSLIKLNGTYLTKISNGYALNLLGECFTFTKDCPIKIYLWPATNIILRAVGKEEQAWALHGGDNFDPGLQIPSTSWENRAAPWAADNVYINVKDYNAKFTLERPGLLSPLDIIFADLKFS